MFVGKVIGTVWATVKWPAVQGQKLLLVRPYHLSDLWAASRAANLPSEPPVDGSALIGQRILFLLLSKRRRVRRWPQSSAVGEIP